MSVANALEQDFANSQKQAEQSAWDNNSQTNEIVLPFHVREQFRPKLMEFFEMTNKRQGAYVWAEEKALAYFEAQGIPREAWNYRTRRN